MSEERVKRTDADSRSHLAISVRGTGDSVDLEIPDRSGELVKRMINDRVWDEELLSSLNDVDGAILFLHVLRFDPGRPAEELAELLPASEEGADTNPETVPGRDDDPIPWSPDLMPADVRAIDLLQAIVDKRRNPLPIAVVISAWDRAQPSNVKPRTWLTHRAPLLAQFLEANEDSLPNAVFGMSAQGYDFTVEDAAADRGRALDPWERAHALDGDGESVGVGQPILWLIEEKR